MRQNLELKSVQTGHQPITRISGGRTLFSTFT